MQHQTPLGLTTRVALVAAFVGGFIPSTAIAQSSASPYTTGYRWDANRRITGIISPDPDGGGTLPFPAIRYTYNPDGLVTKIEKGTLSTWMAQSIAPSGWSGFSPYEITDIQYDVGGRKARETVSAGGAVQKITDYSYDADDKTVCIAARLNLSSPPADACTLSGTQSPDGADRIIKNIYDADGRVAQIRKGVGTTDEEAYVTYSYTANSLQNLIIDANGNKAQVGYDGFDRQQQWTYPSATKPTSYDPSSPATALATAGAVNSGDFEKYAYDNDDNRVSFQKRDGSVLSYTFDASSQVTTKVVPERGNTPASATRDVFYGYDLRGLQKFARFDNSSTGEGTFSAYDKAGRLVSSTLVMDGVTRTLNYGIDADGKRTSLTYPDGAAFSFSYDMLDRMTGIYEGIAQNIRRITIGYDIASRRGSVTRAGADTTGYGYDALSRLQAQTDTFTGGSGNLTIGLSYNAASQIRTRSVNNDSYLYPGFYNVIRNYTANGLNQYQSAGPSSFTYDANGNLTSDGVFNYGYDVENRLISSSGGGTGLVRYDPQGRLYETSGGPAGTRRFLYDGDALVAEYDSAGSVVARYIHGPTADEPMLWYEGASIGSPNYFHTNELGSVISVSDAAGALRAIKSYDPYGVPDSTNSSLGRFSYTGQIWIPELGVHYFKARAYSPSQGRFLQVDPVGYRDDANLYIYAVDDPLNGKDPTGASCTPLNIDSVYCGRAGVYRDYDRRVSDKTRFFGAAASTTTYLANNDIPVFGNVISDQAETFLKRVSSNLESLNTRVFTGISNGQISGPNLDERLVHLEQSRVQSMLDALSKSDRASIVGSLNRAFNGPGRSGRAATFFGPDSAYNKIISKVINSLGRPFDFGKQSDREAIGNALVKAIRGGNSCVTGAGGC